MQFKSDDGSREFFAKWRHGVRVAWMPFGSAVVNRDGACAAFGHPAKAKNDKNMKPKKFSVAVRWWRPHVAAFVGTRRVVSWNW